MAGILSTGATITVEYISVMLRVNRDYGPDRGGDRRGSLSLSVRGFQSSKLIISNGNADGSGFIG